MGVAYSIPGEGNRGGRRLGIDRRRFFIPGYAPERRSNQERRSGQDRRSGEDPGNVMILRRGIDRYMEFVNTQKGLLLGVLMSLPFWVLIIFSIFL